MRKTFTGGGVLGRQSTNCVGVRMLLGAESAQLRFLTLANGRLRDRPDQDLLGGGIEPGRRQSADVARQIRSSTASSSAGGAGRSPGRTGGTTAREIPDLRPIEDALASTAADLASI